MFRYVLIVSALLLALAQTPNLRADQVVAGKTNHPHATITGFQQGRLQFTGADGASHDLWISDVDMIIVDRGGIFNDFNQAERFLAGGEPQRAIIRYRRTLKLSDKFWSDLITARLLVACDRAARIDQATLSFILVVRGRRSGPPAAARLIPQNIPDKRTPKAIRAVEHLDAAIAKGPTQDQRIPLAMLRYKILSHTGDGRASDAGEAVAAMHIPSGQHCVRMYAIQYAALGKRARDDFGPADRASLERAIRNCPKTLLAGFLLLKGETLSRAAVTRDDMIRATWPFMRVVAHMPDDPRAADGLYQTAAVLERMERREKAIDLLTECLAHQHVRAETRRRAEALRKRLRSAGS